MLKRVPIVPTIIVALAVAMMIALGVWQLRRAEWKAQLIATHRAALGRPVLNGLPEEARITRHDIATDDAARSAFDALSYRRTRLACTLLLIEGKVVQIGGRNRADEPGFRNVVDCSTEPFRGRLLVDLGWSEPGATAPIPDQAKARIAGQLNPAHKLTDRLNDPDSDPIPFMLVAETPWPGLQASAPSTPEDIPNNHSFYAVQWFFFAAAAALIYGLALRKRIATTR